jgi:predicted GH43/DUF377 family glycosyl hydrolase
MSERGESQMGFVSSGFRNKLSGSLIIAIIVLSTITAFLFIAPAYGAWWNSDWTYRKKITIDHTKVGENLSNFPLLVDLTDSDLANKARTDGGDIVFTDDLGNKFDHEIEFFNNSSGKLIAWVEVPLLSSTIDTILYMYYGNAASTSQQNVHGTWDSNYVMVQHLKEATGFFYDSTSNGNNGTAYGTISRNITGKLDGAVSFDANHDDYIDAGNSSTLNFGTGNFTISMWLNATTQPGDFYTMLKKLRPSDGEYSITVRCGGAGTNSTRDSIEFGVYDGVTWKHANTASGVLNNAWRYVVALRSGDNITIFVDGTQAATTTGASGLNLDTTGQLWLARHSTIQWYTGKMDEVRMSNVARSAGWIAAEYNNQASPSTFYTVGNEEVTGIQISNPSPSNGQTNVPISLSQLSFNLTHGENRTMDYYVTTNPDIGSGNALGVGNGRYNVAVSGINYGITYTWHVNVSDGIDWSNKTFTFITVPSYPDISGESPANGATNVQLNPTLQASILDAQADSVDWYIRTNASGTWSTIASGTLPTGSGTVSANPTNMHSYNTLCYWQVSAIDPLGSNQWNNKTYSFTTIDQLRILSYSPSANVTLDRGTLELFQLSYNTPVNTTWHLSGVQQETDLNQQTASWTSRFNDLGIFNATAVGTDGISVVKQEWSVQIIINFSGGVVERQMTDFGPSQTWEQGWVFDESIWKENDTFYGMLYAGGPIGQRKIGYAWSTDGFHWTKYAGNPILSPTDPGAGTWENKEVFWTSTILKINGTYWVYYQGIDTSGGQHSGLARGSDLTNLTRYAGNPIIADTYELVVGRYTNTTTGQTMWIGYNGYMHCNFLTSPDGLNWTYVQMNVLVHTSDWWENGGIYAGHIFFLNDTMYLTVQGNNQNGGVVYCRVGDWTNLTRSSYNPIIPHGSGIENFVLGPCPIYNETLDCLDIWYLAVESLGGTGQNGLGFGRVYNVMGSNTAPSVSDPTPSNGAVDIPITTSNLSFNISDAQYDPLNYTVTTFPSIGTGSGANVSNGRYSISISGLTYSTAYNWNVSVYDGQLWTNQTFTFTTEPKTTFDPFSEGWNYRKKITIDHSEWRSIRLSSPIRHHRSRLDHQSSVRW